jgi:hypothetical protein
MKNADELFLKLRSAYSSITFEPPAGYKTTLELSKLWKLSTTRTNEIINRAIKDKILTRVKVMRNSRLVPYYGKPKK